MIGPQRERAIITSQRFVNPARFDQHIGKIIENDGRIWLKPRGLSIATRLPCRPDRFFETTWRDCSAPRENPAAIAAPSPASRSIRAAAKIVKHQPKIIVKLGDRRPQRHGSLEARRASPPRPDFARAEPIQDCTTPRPAPAEARRPADSILPPRRPAPSTASPIPAHNAPRHSPALREQSTAHRLRLGMPARLLNANRIEYRRLIHIRSQVSTIPSLIPLVEGMEYP